MALEYCTPHPHSRGDQPLLSTPPSRCPVPMGPLSCHLPLQDRIAKVMEDYQVLDEFFYSLSMDDFNDK